MRLWVQICLIKSFLVAWPISNAHITLLHNVTYSQDNFVLCEEMTHIESKKSLLEIHCHQVCL